MNARRRVEQTKRKLSEIGVEPDRLKMIQLSSAMGARFAEEAEKMTDEILALGPNPLNGVRSGGDR